MPPKKEKRPLFQPKDMVLAKMTGFPAWPSFVMPVDMVPEAIMRAKKKTTNTCVIFIPDGDFYWMNEKSLEALSPEKLQAKLDKVPQDKISKARKKSTRTSNVVEALIAATDLQFDTFMEDLEKAKASFNDVLVDDEGKEEEDEGEIDQDMEEVEVPTEIVNDDESTAKETALNADETAEIDEATNSHKTSTRASERARRKSPRSGEADEAAPRNGPGKSHATDESAMEEGLADEGSKIEDTAESAKEQPKIKPPTRKRTRRSRSAESEEEQTGNPKEDSSAGSVEPPTKKAARAIRAGSPKPNNDTDRQHQLWLCRIKLQRSLIQRNQPVTPKDPKSFPPPTVDELLMARIILQKLADFPVTVELLRDTKIHKVLKCIVRDVDLEYPDSFRLHEKCKELLDKWHDLIEDLKHGKAVKPESPLGNSAPDDSGVLAIEVKNSLEKELTGKVEV